MNFRGRRDAGGRPACLPRKAPRWPRPWPTQEADKGRAASARRDMARRLSAGLARKAQWQVKFLGEDVLKRTAASKKGGPQAALFLQPASRSYWMTISTLRFCGSHHASAA